MNAPSDPPMTPPLWHPQMPSTQDLARSPGSLPAIGPELKRPFQVADVEPAAPNGPAPNLENDSAESERPAHILLVEDDPPSARLLEASLGSSGHSVRIAKDAESAKAAIAAQPPDLVICDVCLPGPDGIELTAWIRTQETTAWAPILLVTSMDDSKILARGLEAGADDFLTKPVNSLELRTRVRSLLRTKRYADGLRQRRRRAEALTGTTEQTDTAWLSGPSSPSPHAADASAVLSEPQTILIIDDNDRERSMLETYLHDVTCSARTAADGQNGWEMMQRDPPSLVVLDLLMPNLSGYEVIRRMKATPALARIPILAVSAMSEVVDRVRALELGADDFIVKGFDRLEFKARVQRLLRMKRCFDRLHDRCDEAMRLATTDSLTGLATHGLFKELIRRQVPPGARRNETVSLIYADIDEFKQINDRFGHTFGDHVLTMVADRIRTAARTTDTVARYGGEEFVVLLPLTRREEAIQIAERMRVSVARTAIPLPAGNNGPPLRPTISLGVATYPCDASDGESLLQHADEALYAAKQAGRNRVSVFEENGKPAPAMPTVLIADDEERNLRLLEAYLAPEGCMLIKARDGEEALEAARRTRPDLILLDAMMPRLSGFDVCRRLKQEQTTCFIPIVLITALHGSEDRLRGVESGADDFLSKPVNRTELVARMRALVRSKRKTDLLEDAEAVIFTLARAVESRDPSTGGHVERVSHYAVSLGKAIGLPEAQLEGLRRAGVVHDVGKIMIPDSILLKPGELTSEERAIMERHVDYGHDLLRPLRTFAESLPAVRFHHERLDGSGYPLGLRGDQIPIVAQIMGIVDVYDAVTTDRVYRPALSRDEAFEILRDEAARGLHDPKLVEALYSVITAEESAHECTGDSATATDTK